MGDISTIGRHTSGVKLINLDKKVTVAKIAKVREKISDGNQEFDDIEEALEEVPVDPDNDPAEENLIFPTESDEDEE